MSGLLKSLIGKIVGTAAIGCVIYAGWIYWPDKPVPWTEADLVLLQSLWIENLGPVPSDPANAVADNPAAARFGQQLFFDRRLSLTGAVSCSTCHQPERRFTDGLPKAVAIGTARRNTPSIIGVAYSPWHYWDGRRDSLWSQALSPLEDPNEHGSNRLDIVRTIVTDEHYRQTYAMLFGGVPDLSDSAAVDRAFANIGKAIAAYERLLLPGASRFDAYVAALVAGDDQHQNLLNDYEIIGLQLYIGDANCLQCHNGPLFTNNEFHNTGVINFPGDVPDKGRVQGVREVLANPFNCRGIYSDSAEQTCAELAFIRTGPELIGAFRTPSLRNLDRTGPFMHKGQLASLADVLEHYNEAPLALIGHNEVVPLGLSQRQLRQLEAFLLTLAAPPQTDEKWLRPPPNPHDGGSASGDSISTTESL